jgi:pilus assembly protein Flp/PilA
MARFLQLPGQPRSGREISQRRIAMNNMLLKLYVKFQELRTREEGQDLVEYTLLIALVALAAIVGIGKVATALNSEFTTIAGSI